jgi:hypothetical protein
MLWDNLKNPRITGIYVVKISSKNDAATRPRYQGKSPNRLFHCRDRFYKRPSRPKTFRTNFHRHILDKHPKTTDAILSLLWTLIYDTNIGFVDILKPYLYGRS